VGKISIFLSLRSKTVAHTAKVTSTDYYEVIYWLSIDTKIDELG